MSELKSIKQNTVTITLAGKERILKMGMAAMAKIEESFGDIANMVHLIETKPGSTMPRVIMCLMKSAGNEDITTENIAELLDDEYTINDMRDILEKIASTSLPEGKGNVPPKAETV